MINDKKLKIVMDELLLEYPDAKPELDFTNAYELLIATILSAQCTDIRVNKVTAVLFKDGNTPEHVVGLGLEKIKEIIKPCGIFVRKAKYIYDGSKTLIEKYDGQVPSDMDKLMELSGVARKTANVVMSNAFGIPSMAVDTHVFRVTNRIGIVDAKNEYDTEMQIVKRLEKETLTKAHHLFIFHGRRVCKSQNPQCMVCRVEKICQWEDKKILDKKGK